MSQPLPSLVTEAAAGSLAGARLRRYEMGPALIGAGADATVVIVVPGDNPGVSGVQDSTKVLLRGDRASDLHARFAFREPLPVHVFARLDQGCLPLGTALCRRTPSVSADFDHAEWELDRPLGREALDVVRPVPEPGPVPAVDWIEQVETDPIRALRPFVLGWFPAEATEPAEEGSAPGEVDDLPEALASFRRLARLRPAIHGFHDPILRRPRRASAPLRSARGRSSPCGTGPGWTGPSCGHRRDRTKPSPRVAHRMIERISPGQ